MVQVIKVEIVQAKQKFLTAIGTFVLCFPFFTISSEATFL